MFGPTLQESTHNGFLQIIHPRTFHIKNPSNAKLASLSILRKWSVSMATIVKIEKYRKLNISVHIQLFNIDRSNRVVTLICQGQLTAKIKIQRKKATFTLTLILKYPIMFNKYSDRVWSMIYRMSSLRIVYMYRRD